MRLHEKPSEHPRHGCVHTCAVRLDGKLYCTPENPQNKESLHSNSTFVFFRGLVGFIPDAENKNTSLSLCQTPVFCSNDRPVQVVGYIIFIYKYIGLVRLMGMD